MTKKWQIRYFNVSSLWLAKYQDKEAWPLERWVSWGKSDETKKRSNKPSKQKGNRSYFIIVVFLEANDFLFFWVLPFRVRSFKGNHGQHASRQKERFICGLERHPSDDAFYFWNPSCASLMCALCSFLHWHECHLNCMETLLMLFYVNFQVIIIFCWMWPHTQWQSVSECLGDSTAIVTWFLFLVLLPLPRSFILSLSLHLAMGVSSDIIRVFNGI